MRSMIAQCPSCATVFELDPLKVPPQGVRARCSVCSAVITVSPPSLPSPTSFTSGPEESSITFSASVTTPESTAEVLSDSSTTADSSGVEEVEDEDASPEVAPSVSARVPEAPRRRPSNPFLARDPALRAQRLARALISDIVAYHPTKHAEGLRDGTLKTLFREEIKKSYEEYVEQMGREFAESSSHFQDALNDILAGGQRQF